MYFNSEEKKNYLALQIITKLMLCLAPFCTQGSTRYSFFLL